MKIMLTAIIALMIIANAQAISIGIASSGSNGPLSAGFSQITSENGFTNGQFILGNNVLAGEMKSILEGKSTLSSGACASANGKSAQVNKYISLGDGVAYSDIILEETDMGILESTLSVSGSKGCLVSMQGSSANLATGICLSTTEIEKFNGKMVFAF